MIYTEDAILELLIYAYAFGAILVCLLLHLAIKTRRGH